MRSRLSALERDSRALKTSTSFAIDKRPAQLEIDERYTGVRSDLIGRRAGDDIVQIGRRGETTIKWSFSAITSHSFLWQGFVLQDDGLSWELSAEFELRRIM